MAREAAPPEPAVDPSAAAPLAQWLAPALLAWLRAKGCRGITLLATDDDADAPAAPAWRDAPAPGWGIPLGDAANSTVLLAFASRDALTAAELADVGAMFERLRAFPLVHDAHDAVLVDHAAVRDVLHDLRNHLNTLLINGALLARVATTQPSLQRSAQFLESAGQASASALNRLSDLTALVGAASAAMLLPEKHRR